MCFSHFYHFLLELAWAAAGMTHLCMFISGAEFKEELLTLSNIKGRQFIKL